MAKQLGIYQYRGRLGNAVGAKRAVGQKYNSVRAYVNTIANPKTLAQRKQRIKLGPAVNFYRALANILDHSWEGVKYGGPSHNYFMKKALKMKSGFPYLEKGRMIAAPGYYQISSGSLWAPQPFIASDNYFILGFSHDREWQEELSWGQVSEILIRCNNLQNGDQLTFVSAYVADTDMDAMAIQWFILKVVLDTESSLNIAKIFGDTGFKIDADRDGVALWNNALIRNEMITAAIGVIVSRPPRRKGKPWQRSTSFMQCAEWCNDILFSEEQKAKALASYGLNESELTSDWYLNQGFAEGDSSDANASGQNGGSTDNSEAIEEQP